MDPKAHWETVHRTKAPTEVSWYQDHPERSLDFIARTGMPKSGALIDVGGGMSTLADDLLAAGYTDVTVLDIAAAALAVAQARLAERARDVTWIEGDITRVALPAAHYDLWHDRAVFHFLTDPADRARYVAATHHAVKPGGHVIVATFASDGPSQCSGLDVMRYDPASLHDAFGDAFALVDSARETHVTPTGREQRFVYCYCRVG
jgi:2-polyprenyl-3-methyl-5-hydroxy-6-metoxy-1,4-benzoquinol methylase